MILKKIIDALQLLGFIAYDRNAEKVAEKVIAAFRNFLQNEVEIEGLNFKDLKVNPFKTSLFNLTSEIGIQGITDTVQVPKEYVLLNRMVTLLLGICNTLDSNINPLEEVRPYFQKYMLGDTGDMVKFAKDYIQKSALNLVTIPTDMAEVLNKARRGKLEMQLVGDIEKTKLFYALGQQVIFVVLWLAAIGFTYTVYQNGQTSLSRWGMGAAVIFGLLFIRAYREGKRWKRML